MKPVGHRIHTLNEYLKTAINPNSSKEDQLDAHRQMLMELAELQHLSLQFIDLLTEHIQLEHTEEFVQ